MNSAVLADEIFDALQEFDRLSAPFGLYAAGDLAGEEPQRGRKGFTREKLESWKMRRDHPEWEGALLPFFESRGCIITPHFNGAKAIDSPDLGRVECAIKRLSKIKVRQYGSKYHVDKHENFSGRWKELGMDKAVGDLWSSWRPEVDLRLLFFLGFDTAQRPFERELHELKPHQTRASHGIEFFERTWDDSVGRGFKIKAAFWGHQTRTD